MVRPAPMYGGPIVDERPPQSAAERNAKIEREEAERQDRELRFQVLDAAANVEHEFIAVAVFYLGASSAERQEVVEGLIGAWGGMRAATAIIKAALEVHQAKDPETERWLQQVQELRELRNLLAHGTTASWQANPPEMRGGRLGREVRTRTRKGSVELHWIDFEEAAAKVTLGWEAATSLSRRLADVTRRHSVMPGL